MQTIKINPQNPSLKSIRLAAKIIKQGGVVIYPTDTIYGIGASALSREAIGKVYKIKKRPENKPLSIVIRDIKMAQKYCVIGDLRLEIFKAVFPGPFTLIFPAKPIGYDKILTAHKKTISVRIPDCKVTKFLSKELEITFTATSANISGMPGSGDISQVLKQFENNKKNGLFAGGLIDLVLDAGILPKKNPSTIIDLTGKNPKIIRK